MTFWGFIDKYPSAAVIVMIVICLTIASVATAIWGKR